MSVALIEARVIGIVAEHFGVATESLNRGTVFGSDLGADSLDMTEIGMRLEEEEGFDVDAAGLEEALDPRNTIGSLIDAIAVARSGTA